MQNTQRERERELRCNGSQHSHKNKYHKLISILQKERSRFLEMKLAKRIIDKTKF